MRRLLSVISICVVASATVVVAAPKKAKGPVAPAKDAGSGSGSGSGSAAAGSGSGEAVQMTEDAPPADMNGVDENPDAPRGGETTAVVVVAPKPVRRAAYPIEEALRPIVLPQNMSEASLDPHTVIGDGSSYLYAGATALRARYGITDKVQVGITYLVGGLYDDPLTRGKDYGFHSGKAVGPDVTVLLQDWIGVRLGVPVYVQPVAVSILIGAPIKFHFGDKVALGGLDDLLNINVHQFAPSFYQESLNADAAASLMTGTEQSRGHIRFSFYGDYQYQPNLVLIGRFGVDDDLGTAGGSTAGTAGNGGVTTFIRAGLQYSPRRYFDIGGSIGFDDLNYLGSFGPAAYLAVRI